MPSQVSISSVSLTPLPNMERFVVSLISVAFHKVLAQSLHLFSLSISLSEAAASTLIQELSPHVERLVHGHQVECLGPSI